MIEVEIDRECKHCENKVKQTATFKEENGKITVDAYSARCPVCNRFLKKPTPEEIRGIAEYKKTSTKRNDTVDLFIRKEEETDIDIGTRLDNLLKKVKKLQKERTELLRNVEELKEDAKREAKNLEREVSTLKEHAMIFRETLKEMRTRKGTTTLAEVARARADSLLQA